MTLLQTDRQTDTRRESLANRLGEIISAVHVKTYTEIRNGKSVTVREHEDKRTKQDKPQAAPKPLSMEEIKDKVKSAIETAKEKVGSATKKPVQTDTPEFKAWFGDSKVVDKDGKPMVVYHGTTSDFSEFKRVDGGNMWGAGHYFAESAEDAGQYSTHFPNRMTPKGNAAPNVIPVFLQINNPFVMDAPLTEQTKKLVGKEIGEKIDDYSWPGMKNRDIRQMLKEQFVSSWEDANSVLEKIGFDGLVEKNATASQSGARTFMVFKPTQIKSAIGNKGTWSKTDPNIAATDHSADMRNLVQAISRERLARRLEIIMAEGKGHQFHGNQFTKGIATVKPEDFGMKKSGGSLGRMGYLTSNDPAVRISAQVEGGSIFITRLDAIEQGKGHGGKALEKIKAFAAATGRKVELTAGADSKELQGRLNAFYEKHGFTKLDDDAHPSFVWESETVKASDILKCANSDTTPFTPAQTKAKNAQARQLSEAIYEAAAIAAAHKIEADKKKKRDMEIAAILLLLLLAGEDAYLKIYSTLGTDGLKNSDETQIGEQAKTFAASRQEDLQEFAGKLRDAIGEAKAEAFGMPEAEAARHVREAAVKTSQVMIDVESTITLGSIELDRLKRAGFRTVFWSQLDRPTKRHSHAMNQDEGIVKIGHRFSNGQRFPGDPCMGVGEVINCLCQLVPVGRE